MTGQTDLSALLAGMAAELLPGTYVFSSVSGTRAAADMELLGCVSEAEGLSVLVSQEEADRCGLAYDYVAAWITLRVRSSLAAVGLTAAVSTALADAGISCNVVAGYHHDHLLVPVDRAVHALAVLEDLSTGAALG